MSMVESIIEAEEYHQDYYFKNPEAFEKELIESGMMILVTSGQDS